MKDSTKNNKILLIATLFLIGLAAVMTMISFNPESTSVENQIMKTNENPSSTPTPSPFPSLPPIPNSKILDNGGYHIFQSFNNCGPASLSMALAFYGIDVSQETLGDALRPYQVAGGDNDDKSVTLEELAQKSKEYGLIPYHRPMGNPEIVKLLIANDLPVVVRTWTTPTEDIGHFRVIKGYDEAAGTFLQDDSLQNKNLTYTYDDFDQIWDKFNYEYLVLVPPEKVDLVERILGENADESVAWKNAVNYSLQKLQENPNDIDAAFNASVAYYHTGEFENSVEMYESVENQLPFRTLWYQIEPIKSYYELKNYDRVFQITDRVLNNQNRAFSELYLIRGKIYQEQGNLEAAREQYQNAFFYNVNLKEAKELLNSI